MELESGEHCPVGVRELEDHSLKEPSIRGLQSYMPISVTGPADGDASLDRVIRVRNLSVNLNGAPESAQMDLVGDLAVDASVSVLPPDCFLGPVDLA
jgi:hypothetical protein